jgi:Proteasome non-ATPase 26S subunit
MIVRVCVIVKSVMLSNSFCIQIWKSLEMTYFLMNSLKSRQVMLLIFNVLIETGMLKLFGSLCSVEPSSTFSRYRKFVKCLFHLVNGPPNQSITLIAIETVGFIGRTPEGKSTLCQEGNKKSCWLKFPFLNSMSPATVWR